MNLGELVEHMATLEYREAQKMMESLPGLYFETLNKKDGKIRIYLDEKLVWESKECAA